MKKALIAGLFAASLLAPAVAAAQQPAGATDQKTDREFVIRPVQWLAIGAGVVVGAVAVEVIASSELGYIVGGIVGGYLANVWYTGREVELHLGTAPKT